METSQIVIVFVWLLFGGLIGGMIGANRGRDTSGVILGALLGPVGWVFIACVRDLRPRCPECRSVIAKHATRCIHCAAFIPK